MEVLFKYSELPDPAVERHQKHIVSERIRPIRHRHPHTFGRHQTAYPYKKQCRQCSEHGEPVQPRTFLQRSRHQKLIKNSKKGEVGQFINANRTYLIITIKLRQHLCEKIHNLLLGPNFQPSRTSPNKSELRVTIFVFTIQLALLKVKCSYTYY